MLGKPSNTNVLLRLGALLYFIVLIFFSVKYYQERVCLSDAGSTLAHIINGGAFHIQLDRYGSFVPQLILLLALKCNLSLVAVAKAYSIGFVVLSFCILHLSFKYKASRAFMALILYFAISFASNFLLYTTKYLQVLHGFY